MTRWEHGASPAAAAAVSRILSAHDIPRSVEIRRGVELEGFYASPKGDHVRVEYVPGWEGDVAAGLTRCADALAPSYAVERVTAPISQPGGWEDGEVLEVRPR